MRNRDVAMISAQLIWMLSGLNALLEEYMQTVCSLCKRQSRLIAFGTLKTIWCREMSMLYPIHVSSVLRVRTYLREHNGSSYIVTPLGVTLQEQDGLAAVLDFVDQSYNGNVDRHKALHYTAREGEKHAFQMIRLDLIQTEQTSKRACTNITRYRNRRASAASGSVSMLKCTTMYEVV
jgi:hypothetical protein